MYRVVFTPETWATMRAHFEVAGRKEDGAFLLLRQGRTASGARLLVHRVLLPPAGALERQGRDFLRPSGQWLSAVIGTAIEEKCGLAFIHSHPSPYHPPDLSPVDWQTSVTWSQSITPTIDGPFVSLVWSPRGLAGVAFTNDDPSDPKEVSRFDSVGNGAIEQLQDVGDTAVEARDDRQARALSALGNKRTRQLDVGLIGAGGTGSPLAEQLARIGVARIVVVDSDALDDPSNLRRVVGSVPGDVETRTAKVAIVERHIESLSLSTKVLALNADVRGEDAVRRLLDCDVLINTTDTQSSRALLNQIAYQYWMPLIDVGVRVGTKLSGAISGMPAEIRVLLPDNGCLWCRKGILDSQTIYEENLPAGERELLADEGYVQGVAQHQPSLAPLNYVAAGLALLAALRLYSGQPIPLASFVVDPWETYMHPLDARIDPSCICSEWRGLADDLPVAFLPAEGD